MGSLILCHKHYARQPYEITRIHRKIFTIEELCYYLCNNIYLIDDTIINERLFAWLDKYLKLEEMAENLRKLMKKQAPIEQFITTILTSSSIYTPEELNQIQNSLGKLKNQHRVERLKYKADDLLECGAIETAILVYQSILYGEKEKDAPMSGTFYGNVYACLGCAYGRLFLYQEAAKMYEAAFQICEEEDMLVAYLYACSRYMPEDDYKRMIKKSIIHKNADLIFRQKTEKIKFTIPHRISTDVLEEWKGQYRRNFRVKGREADYEIV